MKNKIDIKNITEYGIKIVMNEDKIIKEGKYTLEEIYANTDGIKRFLVELKGSKKISSIKKLIPKKEETEIIEIVFDKKESKIDLPNLKDL